MTVYYVSPTGSDSNDGLSTGAPWQTITKVNAATLNPGDSVLFQGGQSFTGQVNIGGPGGGQNPGTAANPITVGSYGTGRATITSPSGHGIVINRVGGYVVDSLIITGPGAGSTLYFGIYGTTDGTGRLPVVQVSGCTVSGWRRGIEFASYTATGGWDGITIDGCDVSACQLNGILIFGGATAPTGYSHTGLTISHCTVHGTTGLADGTENGDGCLIKNVNGGLIEYCSFYGNGALCSDTAAGPAGSYVQNSNNVVFRHCAAYDNRTGAGAADGGGIDLDVGCTNCVIEYCIAYGNDGCGLWLYGGTDGVHSGNTIRWSVAWGNCQRNAGSGYGDFALSTGAKNGSIYGCTGIARDGSTTPAAIGIWNVSTGNTVRNSIFCGQTGYAAWSDSEPTTDVIFQGNCYYCTGPSGTRVYWNATSYTTLASWRTATGQEIRPGPVNTGIWANPLLEDMTTEPAVTDPEILAPAAGLLPQTGSPCLGTGLDLSGLFGVNPGSADFFGTPLPPALLPVGAAFTPLTLRNDAETGTDGVVITGVNSAGPTQDGFDLLAGSPTFESTGAIHGGLSFSTPLAGFTTAQVGWSAATGGALEGWDLSHFWARDYVTIPAGAFPLPAVMSICWVNNATPTGQWAVAIDSATSKVGIRSSVGGYIWRAQSASALAAGTHRIEYDATWDDPDWTVTVRLYYGTSREGATPSETLGPVTFAGTAGVAPGRAAFGVMTGAAQTWAGILHDDVAVSTGGWIGPYQAAAAQASPPAAAGAGAAPGPAVSTPSAVTAGPAGGAGSAPGPSVSAAGSTGIKVGGWIKKQSYPPGNLTLAQAVAAFEAHTGRPLAVRRFYVGKWYMPVSIANVPDLYTDITAGRKVVMDYKPYYYGAPVPLGGGTSQAALDANVSGFFSSCATAGLDAVVTLWAEPYYNGISGGANADAADFIAMFRHYAPIIRSYGFQVGFNTSAGSVHNNSENSYYPGDAWVDVCAVDYYATAYLAGFRFGGGGSTDPAQPADAGNKPLGLYEFMSSTDPVQGQTPAQAADYWAYVLSYFQGRVAAGKPCADLLIFNSDSNLAQETPIIVADGQAGYGGVTEYRNALYRAIYDGFSAPPVPAVADTGPAAAAGTAPQPTVGTAPMLPAAGPAASGGQAPGPAITVTAGWEWLLMADSLILARHIELLGGDSGAESTLPGCEGVRFRLGDEFSFGSPEPVEELVVQLIGDGSRPTVSRMGNRLVELPLRLDMDATADEAADRAKLAAAREALMRLVNTDEFTLQWAPGGSNAGRNLIFDCYHAKGTVVSYSLLREAQRVSVLTISFEAAPYGRSDEMSELVFTAPVTGQDPPPEPVLIDGYATVSSTTQAPWWDKSVRAVAGGSASARWHHDWSDADSPLIYTRTLGAAVDVTGRPKLTFWLGLGADSHARWRHWHHGILTFTFTLTDDEARTLSFGCQVHCDSSDNQEWPTWNQVSASIPQGKTFDYAHVTGYSVTCWSEVRRGGIRELDTTGYLCQMTALPPVRPRPASDRGRVEILYSPDGSAPAPLNIHAQQPPGSVPGDPAWHHDFGTLADGTAVTPASSAGTGEVAFDTCTTTGSGTLTALSAAAVHGARGMRSATTASTSTAYAAWTLTSLDELWLRACIRFGASPAAADNLVWIGVDGTRAFKIYATTGRALQIIDSAGVTIATFTNVPAIGTAFRVEAHVTFPGDATAACDVWLYTSVDGTTPTETKSLTGQTFGAGPATQIRFGQSNSVASNVSIDYDDLAVSATGKLGAAGVAGTTVTELLAGTPGVTGSWTPPAGVTSVTPVLTAGGGGGGGCAAAGINAAGGGGGGQTVYSAMACTPGVACTYQRGKGGDGGQHGHDGTDGGDSWFTALSSTLTAYGGGHGGGMMWDYDNGHAGTAGTGGTAGTRRNGGTGAAGDYAGDHGGGGGGAGGYGGAGGAASGKSGGTGGTGGGLNLPGGAGGAGGGGGDGSPGNTPGAGGGGAQSGGVNPRNGGRGADGRIMVQYTLPAGAESATPSFSTLLLHRPSRTGPLLGAPVIQVGNASDPPDGREYSIPEQAGQPARYAGTYRVYAVAYSLSGTAARTVTATFRQYDYEGASSPATGTASASVTPGDVVNGMINLGTLTLPLRDMAPDNTGSYFTVAIDAGPSDLFLDIVLVDTQGSTVLINCPSGYSDYWIDAPEGTADIGRVLGSLGGRDTAASVLAYTDVSGGPLRAGPGDVPLVIYSPQGGVSLEASYWPAWYFERLAV